MNYLEDLLRILYKYLTGTEVSNSNIIRRHTRELEQSGDLSFPLNISNWRSQIEHSTITDDAITIFQYLSNARDNTSSVDVLIEESRTWSLHILKCVVRKNNVHAYLDRTHAFGQVIDTVQSEKEYYGRLVLDICNDTCLECVCEHNDHSKMNLTELRLSLIKNVAANLLKFCNINVINGRETDCKTKITFTFKTKTSSENCVLCGAVLNDKGLKDMTTTADQFFQKRTVDMRLMAQHKYGLRLTSQVGWKELFESLGEAAVIIELLQNKPSHTTKIYFNDHTMSSCKGSSFILYNCARLASLFKEFDRRVSSDVYPKLPALVEVDFSLLNQPEEWELLYVYVLQFPMTIKNCIKDIFEGQFNPHLLISMLSGLVLAFSVYYRRVKILTEPRQHLFAVLHARIHMLKALEQVVHNGLRLLNIQPVRQM